MELMVYRFEPIKVKIEVDDNITDKQFDYIDAVEEYKYKYKKVPTIRKMQEILGIKSPESVHYHLRKLKEKGYDYSEINYR